MSERSEKAMQWAKLAAEFHEMPANHTTLVFADACRCGGRLHEWGTLAHACPARSKKQNRIRMVKLGEVIRAS